METDKLFKIAQKVLQAAGIKPGQQCLDFGCGRGNYTIPLAKIIGPKGIVYALDKETSKLEKLLKRAQEMNLENIKTIVSSGSKIPLNDDSIDVVLLYDVLHPHYFSSEERKSLFQEITRITKSQAILSIFPHHMDHNDIEEEIIHPLHSLGFCIVDEYNGPIVHDDEIIEEIVYTFQKHPQLE